MPWCLQILTARFAYGHRLQALVSSSAQSNCLRLLDYPGAFYFMYDMLLGLVPTLHRLD